MRELRKARIKTFAKAKSGGFRVDYLDFPEVGITYYIVIYSKIENKICGVEGCKGWCDANAITALAWCSKVLKLPNVKQVVH
ncbi:hypothetical protein [Candidatus Protochlamydia sp. W-9]|uniref:hypothetical protein n=1 Tax=Candidatus Protochlamydia sp. W-9 TaxID=1785087 RepID=UPI00096AA2D1|nr:hypothetical protein [Candidatus Protochlamydia sp. W-9]